MNKDKPTLFLLSDLYYQAKGREYFKEDIELSRLLRKKFHVLIGNIKDVEKILNQKGLIDLVLIRNTGPRSSHQLELEKLKANQHLAFSNDLQGKGDILGKKHLVHLFQAGYPTIPSVDSLRDLHKLGDAEKYVLKPIDGCDSIDVKIVNKIELFKYYEGFNGNNEYGINNEKFIIQPLLDFEYEVSFYFIDCEFYYALYAPIPESRWNLKLFHATKEQIEVAQRFIDWNTSRSGIQRVDLCRIKNGTFLLMELEDYNPYLSLSILPDEIKGRFIEGLYCSLLTVSGRVGRSSCPDQLC